MSEKERTLAYLRRMAADYMTTIESCESTLADLECAEAHVEAAVRLCLANGATKAECFDAQMSVRAAA